MNEATVFRFSPDAILPKKQTMGSAGYDVQGNVYCTILPFKTVAIPSGLAILPPLGTYVRMTSRSSLALSGLMVPAEVIDPDFTGEFHIILYNGSTHPVTIIQGQKLAQIIFEKFACPAFKETDEHLPSTGRGNNGLGSTF